jgi:monofunctional biosynthetic peptidoglycan transglycosylase
MLRTATTARPAPNIRGWLRAIAIIVGALVLLPYIIAPFYTFGEPVSTLMLWRYVTGQRVERTYVPIERISPALSRAVVIAEDGRFCDHYGIDLHEIREALSEGDDLGDVRGASTITQQLAKNLFLWPGHSFIRKALEIPLALWIDAVLSKRRILELYLNVAEMGPDGVFGAEAGSRRAFGKSAQRLSAYQAALLAASLPNPATRNAHSPGPGLRRLAGLYVARAARVPTADQCVRR